MEQLRQPIITVLGHVDHGKTSLLDKIRQTAVAAKEAGGITQAIGTTEIPAGTIKEICGSLLEKFRINVSIPGLLFIDTPGHEAFVTLRKRGGSIADLAVVVVDLMEGPMPQTIESVEILRQSKVPFVVAINKIDRLEGWNSGRYFLENFELQSDDVKGRFEEKFYRIVEQLSTYGTVERFDRISDFTKAIAAIPVSAKTGEGVAELLSILTGLAQQFLKQRLIITDQGKGMILEIKEVTGLGTTIDTIIYDGVVSRSDYLVIGGRIPRITKIRALLVPEPMRDIRVEKKFRSIDECRAAIGVKISAPGLDDVIAGSPIKTAKTLEEAEALLDEVEEEKEDVEIQREAEGLILKADTIGSLEAMINIFRAYPIREATIGQITKSDIIRAEANGDVLNRLVIGFNTKISGDMENFAKDKKVKILESNIVYRLLEDYEEWSEKEKEDIRKKELDALTRPAKIKIIPGCVFRTSNPAIVGCEVLGGIIKPNYKLMKDGKEIGEVKQIQVQGKNVEEAKIGEKVAVSIIGPTIGRQIDESDTLYTDIPGEDYKKMLQLGKFLSEHEKKVLEEILAIKRGKDARYGM